MRSRAVWLAGLVSAVILLLGVRAFLDPLAASASFGLPMHTDRRDGVRPYLRSPERVARRRRPRLRYARHAPAARPPLHLRDRPTPPRRRGHRLADRARPRARATWDHPGRPRGRQRLAVAAARRPAVAPTCRSRAAPAKPEAPQASGVPRTVRRRHGRAMRAAQPLPSVSRNTDPCVSAPETRGVCDDGLDHHDSLPGHPAGLQCVLPDSPRMSVRAQLFQLCRISVQHADGALRVSARGGDHVPARAAPGPHHLARHAGGRASPATSWRHLARARPGDGTDTRVHGPWSARRLAASSCARHRTH